jgi:hypothetical protein
MGIMSKKFKIFTGVLAFLPLCSWALLDDAIVSFEVSDSGLDTTHSNIICSQDDEAGVHIAAESLAADFEQINGIGRSVLKADEVGAIPRITLRLLRVPWTRP